jgi:hypothetical protein
MMEDAGRVRAQCLGAPFWVHDSKLKPIFGFCRLQLKQFKASKLYSPSQLNDSFMKNTWNICFLYICKSVLWSDLYVDVGGIEPVWKEIEFCLSREAHKQGMIYGLAFAFSEAVIFLIYAAAFYYGSYLVGIGIMVPTSVYR